MNHKHESVLSMAYGLDNIVRIEEFDETEVLTLMVSALNIGKLTKTLKSVCNTFSARHAIISRILDHWTQAAVEDENVSQMIAVEKFEKSLQLDGQHMVVILPGIDKGLNVCLYICVDRLFLLYDFADKSDAVQQLRRKNNRLRIGGMARSTHLQRTMHTEGYEMHSYESGSDEYANRVPEVIIDNGVPLVVELMGIMSSDTHESMYLALNKVLLPETAIYAHLKAALANIMASTTNEMMEEE